MCRMSPKFAQFCFAGMMAVAAGSLAACSMSAPTFMSRKKIEVVEDVRHLNMETARLDKAALSDIAGEYLDHGDGPVHVTVTYDPAVRGNTAMMATDNAARISSSLRRLNVGDVEAEILPVHGQAASTTLISYTNYTARAPGGCANFDTLDDNDPGNYRDYELGCSTETYIARQVARPQDLLGREGNENLEDGRKWGNVVEYHKEQVRNQPLNGEQASE